MGATSMHSLSLATQPASSLSASRPLLRRVSPWAPASTCLGRASRRSEYKGKNDTAGESSQFRRLRRPRAAVKSPANRKTHVTLGNANTAGYVELYSVSFWTSHLVGMYQLVLDGRTSTNFQVHLHGCTNQLVLDGKTSRKFKCNYYY